MAPDRRLCRTSRSPLQSLRGWVVRIGEARTLLQHLRKALRAGQSTGPHGIARFNPWPVQLSGVRSDRHAIYRSVRKIPIGLYLIVECPRQHEGDGSRQLAEKTGTVANIPDAFLAPLPIIGKAAAFFLTAITLLGCSIGANDSSTDEHVIELEARAQSLEESLQVLESENAGLKEEIAVLRQQQTDFVVAQEAAQAAMEHEEEVADFEEEQEEQLNSLEEGQIRTGERLDDLEARLQKLEDAAYKAIFDSSDKEEWSNSKSEKLSPADGTILDRTVRMVEDSGGEVHFVDHPGRGDRTVLVAPQVFVEGETPLIVSLHGYGGNSADHSAYIPLHEHVNSGEFALLLPNGSLDGEGNPFWNPTDRCCDGGKSGENDVAYLTELVEEAKKIKDFGPVYFFGYSNGGFMAHHMACKGLPGIRAIASLAGTSYVEESGCKNAPPVSVLHIHGTADSVIKFRGEESEPDSKGDGERAFYAGAQEMVARWSRLAGCDWPEDSEPYATFDFDEQVRGSETRAFRLGPGCGDGITVELWSGEGSGHAPGYGDAFVDALLNWLLSQD